MPRRELESVNCSLITLEALENENPVTFNALIYGEMTPLVAIRSGGAVHVFANSCPHQGRRLDYAPDRFLTQNGMLVCPAHGAAFDMNSGHCLQGPCRGASLRSYGCSWQAGVLRVEWPERSV